MIMIGVNADALFARLMGNHRRGVLVAHNDVDAKEGR
jgi:hypothetical protein